MVTSSRDAQKRQQWLSGCAGMLSYSICACPLAVICLTARERWSDFLAAFGPTGDRDDLSGPCKIAQTRLNAGQVGQESNLQPAVLETAALPIELPTYGSIRRLSGADCPFSIPQAPGRVKIAARPGIARY